MTMPVSWISNTARLQNGISLINSISTTKFNLLLTHILHSNSDNLFTIEELQKLQDSLKFAEADVHLLIQSIAYIFKQSCRIILKPTTLKSHLTDNLKFEIDKADEFIKIWSNATNTEFDNFSTKTKLVGLNWDLNLQSSSTFCNKQTAYTTKLQLNLTDVEDNTVDPLILEVDEDELTQLYTTLENIQLKLDMFNK